MKQFNLFPIFFLIISISSLDAQVLAGVTGNLTYTASTINQGMATNPVNNYSEFQDGLDLDGDNIDDIVFLSTISNVPDFVGSNIGIYITNPTLQIVYDSIFESNLPMSTPIISDSSWTVSDYGSIAYDFIGFAGPTTGGNWYTNNEGYLGFRMEVGSEIRYGWIHVFAFASEQSFSLIVYGSAIESVVNSNSEISIPHFNIYPNPSSTGQLNLDIDSQLVQSVQVFSLDGKKIPSTLTYSQNQLDVSILQNGFYILQVKLNDGDTYSKKIMVQR